MNILKSSTTTSRILPVVGLRRNLSQKASHTSDLAKILVFPITQDKSYIHFKYNEDLVNNDSTIVKYENKLTGVAAKGWDNLKTSDKSYNKKIVHWVEKFLERTPWIENSLISIPSKSALLRQAYNTDESNKDKKPTVSLTSINDLKTDHELLSIPVYYPGSIISASKLKTELLSLSQNGQQYHRKQMVWNAIGIPLTLPCIIVPVVPNIPGFYLAYRLYCNLKAYLGAQHLEHIAIREDLAFQENAEIEAAYAKQDTNSQILLNEEIIDKLVETFGVKDIKSHLLKALKQEKSALNK